MSLPRARHGGSSPPTRGPVPWLAPGLYFFRYTPPVAKLPITELLAAPEQHDYLERLEKIIVREFSKEEAGVDARALGEALFTVADRLAPHIGESRHSETDQVARRADGDGHVRSGQVAEDERPARLTSAG